MKERRALLGAIYRLYEHSGFSMAGSVAFSFVVSLFPFCIFLGALSGVLGGRGLAQQAITLVFKILPDRVAGGLVPEIEAVLGRSRFGLLTLSAAIALFFATSAIETLRTALNGAYRVVEKRPYLLCLLLSLLFVFVNAIGMLVVTWVVVVSPVVAERVDPELVGPVVSSHVAAVVARYLLAGLVITLQLLAIHLWLAAGKRTIFEVWPGVLLSVVLSLSAAGLYSYYLDINDYSRFYAGLTQIMVALLYFQVTAIIVLLGAELNRGLIELRRLRAPEQALSPQ